MFITTKSRSTQSEIMDNFSLEGDVLQKNLDEIAKINQILGGNQLTLQGVQKLTTTISKSDEIVIVDVGCGNGDMLRMLANYALKSNLKFKLIGIDANHFTINYAIKMSSNYPNIDFQCMDIFKEDFKQLNYDIVLCTLTLHHFSDAEIEKLMTIFHQKASLGIVINDLHRNILAYRLFQLISMLFRLHKISKSDGLTSILRGFKKEELLDFSKKIQFKNYTIHWKWAFRYQWIIRKG